MKRRSWIVLPLAIAVVAAACSDDSGDETSASTTTEAPPLVTSASETTSTTVAPPTTEEPEEELDRMPLTGAVVENAGDVPDRPALVVKIDNISGAWPQYGLNSADIIFEEIINDNVTRFAAVFHSEDAERVGPIRSGRLQDIDLLGALNRPLFAWSGGNSIVEAAMVESDLVSLKHGDFPDLFYRDSSHASRTEWTLFSGTPELFGAAPDDAEQPTAIFTYLDPDEKFSGDPAAGLQVQMDSYEARWEWNADEESYSRLTNGAPHETADAGQLTTDNVVVVQMEYVEQVGSPDAVTANSSGRAWVFSEGQVIEGRWSRKGRRDGFHLTTEGPDGRKPIKLPPGRTFVELARNTDDGIPQVIAPNGE